MLINLRNALMAGKRWKNPYVTDGLVAMWDGEWNAGGGVHDPNATTVKNAVTGIGDLDLTGGYTIGDNFVQFDGVSGCGLGAKLQNTGWNGLTIEYAFTPVATSGSYGSCGWTYAGPSSQRPSFYVDNGGTFYVLMTGYKGNIRRSGVARTACCLTSTGSSGSVIGYKNGIGIVSSTDTNQDFSATANHFRVASYGGTSDNTVGYYAEKMHCVRIYSRALTTDEIAANYAIDKERFGLP